MSNGSGFVGVVTAIFIEIDFYRNWLYGSRFKFNNRRCDATKAWKSRTNNRMSIDLIDNFFFFYLLAHIFNEYRTFCNIIDKNK